jgi:hypothetical protein
MDAAIDAMVHDYINGEEAQRLITRMNQPVELIYGFRFEQGCSDRISAIRFAIDHQEHFRHEEEIRKIKEFSADVSRMPSFCYV